jgi:hypothetical protein
MNSTIQKNRLLPAAMMSLVLANSPVSTAVASVATADAGQALNTRVPVVMQFEPNTKGLEPSVLRDYVKTLSEKTGYVAMMMNDDLEPEGQCGSISGSDRGWDDSKFDC